MRIFQRMHQLYLILGVIVRAGSLIITTAIQNQIKDMVQLTLILMQYRQKAIMVKTNSKMF